MNIFGWLFEKKPFFREKFSLISNCHVVLRDSEGKIKDERMIHNTMKNAGIYGIMDQFLASPTLAKVGWMAVGTGTPAATLLGTETDRNALTSKTRTNGVVTMVGDWAAGDATAAITEAGLFDVVTANTVNMWCSASFDVINKAAGDSLSITWTITGS
jgi:hypothetical protein